LNASDVSDVRGLVEIRNTIGRMAFPVAFVTLRYQN